MIACQKFTHKCLLEAQEVKMEAICLAEVAMVEKHEEKLATALLGERMSFKTNGQLEK